MLQKQINRVKGTFIYSRTYDLVRSLVSQTTALHATLKADGFYANAKQWLFNITATGFLMWLVMITFFKQYPFWSIPVFGIAEWLVLELIQEIRKRWTS